MTSLSTVSAGSKPPIQLLEGRTANVDGTSNGAQWAAFNSCLTVAYSGADIGVETTLINISASGVLNICTIFADGNNTTSNAKCIIDGTTVLDDTRNINVRYTGYAIAGGGTYYPAVNPGSAYAQQLIFNTSCVVKFTCDTAATLCYNYYLN